VGAYPSLNQVGRDGPNLEVAATNVAARYNFEATRVWQGRGFAEGFPLRHGRGIEPRLKLASCTGLLRLGTNGLSNSERPGMGAADTSNPRVERSPSNM